MAIIEEAVGAADSLYVLGRLLYSLLTGVSGITGAWLVCWNEKRFRSFSCRVVIIVAFCLWSGVSVIKYVLGRF